MSHANVVRVVAPESAIASATSATIRRSCTVGDGAGRHRDQHHGSISAVCTSATLSADDVICVIAQAAPTPWIRIPRLESRLAARCAEIPNAAAVR